MNLQEYAESVASRVLSSNADGVSSIAAIIALVLPILSMFPCLPKSSSSSDKREWVENHSRLAVAQTASEIRRQARGEGEKVARAKSRELATTVVNDYLSSTDEQLQSMGLSN